MEIREKILEAALKVFAETGYRGATTRRIAQLAEVNEVTLFRHFGSKDDLIHQALHREVQQEPPLELPENPVDPAGELGAWAAEYYRRLLHRAPMLRACIGDSAEHPEMAGCVSQVPTRQADDLRKYLRRVKSEFGNGSGDPDVAATVLISVLFSDAVTRPMVGGMYTLPPEEAPVSYAMTLLNALGVKDAK